MNKEAALTGIYSSTTRPLFFINFQISDDTSPLWPFAVQR